MSQPLIEFRGVSQRWDGRTVLQDVDLRVDRGDFLLISGPNGGGKTTLLRIMLKLLRPTAGSVTYFSGDGTVTDALSIGYLPQKSSVDSRFPISVSEVVGSALLSRRHEDTPGRVARALRLVGLEEHASRPLGDLSGGQVQRALFARAIVSGPSLLVLDEPMSYLDRDFRERVCEVIGELARETTVVVVSHELEQFSTMASRQVYVDRTACRMRP